MKFEDNLLLKSEQLALPFHHVWDGLRQGQVAAWPGMTLLDVFVGVFF